MSATTTATPTGSAVPGRSPSVCSQPARSPARVAPPKAPASTPISVMPIWTLERKRDWLSSRRNAALAPALPFSAMAARRGRREETRASSARAKKPFSTIRQATTPSSRAGMAGQGQEEGRREKPARAALALFGSCRLGTIGAATLRQPGVVPLALARGGIVVEEGQEGVAPAPGHRPDLVEQR